MLFSLVPGRLPPSAGGSKKTRTLPSPIRIPDVEYFQRGFAGRPLPGDGIADYGTHQRLCERRLPTDFAVNDVGLVLSDDGESMRGAGFVFGFHTGSEAHFVARLCRKVYRNRRLQFGLEVAQVAFDLGQPGAVEVFGGVLQLRVFSVELIDLRAQALDTGLGHIVRAGTDRTFRQLLACERFGVFLDEGTAH